ncbi:ribosome maturation factor RimP [Clostridium ganghwense]|uniref:Ribosome maturation factor RimP n=1 Tax=Clostridium ganghwense TaxID=312089 RepID=A0ABT4CTW1_9CLOT|nr:ribosome maturation factor RimP [Clostridium ganghwense]MCY6372514.1 ribosome maturation factor RimP [Clostridium ganghwense]
MKRDVLLDELSQLIEPIVSQLAYELYHIEYVKEQGENYLRLYIDKEEGISLEDCEKVSRKVSSMLDEKDPIEDSYYLEVSSPGVERILYSDKHLNKYINHMITIKLFKLFEGSKKYQGELLSFSNDFIEIEIEDSKLSIPRDKIKKIILKGEF